MKKAPSLIIKLGIACVLVLGSWATYAQISSEQAIKQTQQLEQAKVREELELDKPFYSEIEHDHQQARKRVGLLSNTQTPNPDSLNWLADMYWHGINVPVDLDKAFSYMMRAAKLGSRCAQNNLGVMYLNGEGTTKNLQRANFWFEQAAKSGHAKAQCNLAQSYYMGRGVKRNYDTAFKWSEQSAKQGVAQAQDLLAYMYFMGHGVPQNEEKAFLWFARAAQRDYPAAQVSLGLLYKAGIGTPVNERLAHYWMREAAMNQQAVAQYHLGNWCEEQDNIQEAFYWLNRACELGYLLACHKLDVNMNTL